MNSYSDRQSAEKPHMELLKKGRSGNADLYLFHKGGEKLVLKSFSGRSWLVRNTIGRFLISREIKALVRLRDLPGIPHKALRVNAFTLCYRFTEARQVSEFYDRKDSLGTDYFTQLESLVAAMHEFNLVHLDMRNRENVMVTEEGKPLLLDFQSYLDLKLVPKILHPFLKQIDESGIYKHWLRISPDTISKRGKAILKSVNSIRSLWFIEGYMFQDMINSFFSRQRK